MSGKQSKQTVQAQAHYVKSFSQPPAKGKRKSKKVDPKTLWPSPEAFAASEARHQQNWSAIIANLVSAGRSLSAKLEADQEVMDLTPLERQVLALANRRKASAGPSGPKSPSEALKALLGFVIPVLGKYATDIALQWLNAEIKYVYTTISGNVSTTSGYNLLNGIAQGTDYNQRVGNSVRILGFDLRGRCLYAPTSTKYEQVFRFIVGIDLQSDGALPTDTQLAEGGSLTTTSLVPSVLKAPDRFAFFMDRHFVLTNNNSSGTAHYFSDKLDNLVHNNVHTLFDLTTGVIAAISRGAMFCAVVSDQAAAADEPFVELNFRVFYEDT